MITKNILHKLYITEKKSVSEVASILRCSENKINYWINKHGVTKRNISEAIYVKKNPSGDPFKQPKKIKQGQQYLYGLGLGLFWGEGNKKSKNSVRLGNTDPYLIQTFIIFLVDIFKIKKSKLKFGIQIFDDLDKEVVIKYWIKMLGIQREQIYPSVVVSKSSKKGTYKNKSEYGVITVYFNNMRLKKVLDVCIERMKKID